MMPDPLEVLRLVAGHDAAMQVLADPSACVLQHVTLRADDGGEVRLDSCPCPLGVESLPKDDLGQPILERLGDGHYLSSRRHTLADVVRAAVGE